MCARAHGWGLLISRYTRQTWDMNAAAAALFDHARSAPEVLSKDDKKGLKARKKEMANIEVKSDIKASEMKM